MPILQLARADIYLGLTKFTGEDSTTKIIAYRREAISKEEDRSRPKLSTNSLHWASRHMCLPNHLKISIKWRRKDLLLR
jgi:hypothetical protein